MQLATTLKNKIYNLYIKCCILYTFLLSLFNFKFEFMDKKEGYFYAIESGLIEEEGDDQNFYKLFKSVARLTDLTSTEKIILTIILSYTSRKMEFFMSNKILAEETGMNYISVIRCINKLRDLKYIKTYKKYRDGKMIGRVIKMVKGTMDEQLKKSWGNIRYEEYGQEEEGFEEETL